MERFLYLIQSASKRLRNVVIENKNALTLIRERDRPGGLIYCDPPYFNAERLYRYPESGASGGSMSVCGSACLPVRAMGPVLQRLPLHPQAVPGL